MSNELHHPTTQADQPKHQHDEPSHGQPIEQAASPDKNLSKKPDLEDAEEKTTVHQPQEENKNEEMRSKSPHVEQHEQQYSQVQEKGSNSTSNIENIKDEDAQNKSDQIMKINHVESVQKFTVASGSVNAEHEAQNENEHSKAQNLNKQSGSQEVRQGQEKKSEQNKQDNLMVDCSTEESIQSRVVRVEKLVAELSQTINQEQLEEYLRQYTVFSSQVLDFESLQESEFLRIKRFKSGFYFGETQNGSRTGKGIMVYYSGRHYEGDWQNDSKFGIGYECFPNGSCYLGAFVNGKPEGNGFYIWNNGETYDGDWVNGMKHGQGEWYGSKGDSYVGEWKFGKADGKGVHKWINGDEYDGEFKCCLKHGKGIEKFSNGDYYDGYYANGRPEGEGQYFWKDGAYYQGTFKNGLRHGEGMWKKNRHADLSDSYVGEYVNDKRCGYGVFNWTSGNIYKGEYFEDLRHGYGEMYWKDTSYYKGQWEKGVQSGEGELMIAGDGIKRGMFVNNVFKQFSDNEGKVHQYHHQSGHRSLKSISEDNFTPQRAHQGSSSKRQFYPNSHNGMSDESFGATPKEFQQSESKLPQIRLNKSSSKSKPLSEDGSQIFSSKQSSDPHANEDSMSKVSQTNEQQYRRRSRRNSETSEFSIGTQTDGLYPARGKSLDKGRDGVARSKGRAAVKLPRMTSAQRSPSQSSSSKFRETEGGDSEDGRILLRQNEIVLWQGMRVKLGIKPKELRDFTDPNTVEIIRGYLKPKVWKPAGVAQIRPNTPSLSPSHNGLRRQSSTYSKSSKVY